MDLNVVAAALLASPEPPTPAALTFLVRRYPAAPSADLHDAITRGLNVGLAEFGREDDPAAQWRWIGAFAEATLLSADDVLDRVIDEELPAAVDRLEYLIRHRYEPGAGLGAAVERELDLMLAVLIAFDLTGRLPYAMLAEELFQTMRRSWRGPVPAPPDPLVEARAAQVCCRLEALHRDGDYRARAVIAPDAAYAATADALLARWPTAAPTTAIVAEFGLARLDRFALDALPH